MNFCPRCGRPLARKTVAGRERPVCPACGYIVFRNPVPVAVVVARQGERILLVRRANEPLRGYWAPPAGYIEIDETLEAGAAREVREETGYEVVIERLLDLHSRPNTGIVFAVYEGRIVGGRPRPDEDETLDLGLFAPAELPQQDPPAAGTEIDAWFFEVTAGLLARFESGKEKLH